MSTQVNGPAVIPSRKLLRDAFVARSIPGLGIKQSILLKKPSQSVSAPFRIRVRETSTTTFDRTFTFPDRVPYIHRDTKNVLIVGAGRLGQEIANYLAQNKQHFRTVKGFLDEDRALDARTLGKIDDLAEVARTQFIDEVIVAIPHDKEGARLAIVEALRNHLDVRIVPELFPPGPSYLSMSLPVLLLHEEPIPEFGLLVKRAIDFLFASIGLLASAPLLAVIAAAIRIDSPGSVLYRAPRVGKKGRTFVCCKFRTMLADAEGTKESLRARNERSGPLFKVTDDPRITRVGKFLRRYSLDELPQLWNVIQGSMSLVGPRPHPLDDYQRYGLQHRRRLDVTPGLTGLWQVTARRDPSFYKNMELDLEYIDGWTLWLDLKIMFQTLKAVLTGTGS